MGAPNYPAGCCIPQFMKMLIWVSLCFSRDNSKSSLPLHYLFDTDIQSIKEVRMELLGRV